MKRKGNIYPKIYDKENIRYAIKCASRGKTDRENVKKIINNIDYYINQVYELLLNKTYKPSPYEKKEIIDGVKNKKRIIYKPRFFPDQVIHWCLMLQIEEILQKPMYYYSCASIKGKGVKLASTYIKKILKQDFKNTKYCLKADITKYFPSIDRNILKNKIREVIKCNDTLWLIDQIIDSCNEGVPIGNYTSQWFANFYLQKFDHFIKEKSHIKYYVRYMDDIVIFHKNKKTLHNIKNEIEQFLNNEHLVMKQNWQIFRTDSRPLDFLGYKFYRTHTELRGNLALRIKRRAKKIYKKKHMTVQDAGAMISYYGWIKGSNSRNFYIKNVKKYINIQKCKKIVRDYNRNNS